MFECVQICSFSKQGIYCLIISLQILTGYENLSETILPMWYVDRTIFLLGVKPWGNQMFQGSLRGIV